MKRLTLSMPCFGRKKGTIRAIECIANQTANNWEALVIGDGCSIMQDFVDSNYFADIQKDCEAKGNDLYISNTLINKGGHGYDITNRNIMLARGKYFMFFANDDVILPNHFENYLSAIEDTDYDFRFFNSLVVPHNQIRNAKLEYGHIGHSELIVRTDFLRQMPKHNEHYGHDWTLIQTMAKSGKHFKSANLPTYHVMSLSDKREEGIE
jgi:glycosyltransferase involved in cell wall biosynthesis